MSAKPQVCAECRLPLQPCTGSSPQVYIAQAIRMASPVPSLRWGLALRPQLQACGVTWKEAATVLGGEGKGTLMLPSMQAWHADRTNLRPLKRAAWQHPVRLKICMLFGPETSLLRVHPDIRNEVVCCSTAGERKSESHLSEIRRGPVHKCQHISATELQASSLKERRAITSKT